MIAATILFFTAVGIAVWSITLSITTASNEWLLFLFISLFCIVGGVAAVDLTPTNKNVRDGEAHYVEQNHIEVVNGDTVNIYKTYEIVWNQNTK